LNISIDDFSEFVEDAKERVYDQSGENAQFLYMNGEDFKKIFGETNNATFEGLEVVLRDDIDSGTYYITPFEVGGS
jgi:hypothetical protein